MSRIIPNENTYIGWLDDTSGTALSDYKAPAATALAGAVELTGLTISVNASARGNTVPTPSFDTLFETSVNGTTTATFDADFYRDSTSVDDKAWTNLTRGKKGYFIISRVKKGAPVAADKVEVWPVIVTSRTMANMSSNTVLTFTVSCAVPKEPAESATVA